MSRLPWVLPVTVGKRLPYGLVSLWDMERFHLDAFCETISFLWRHEEAKLAHGDPAAIALLNRILGLCKNHCEELDLPISKDRIERLELILAHAPALAEVETELRVLRETMISESKRRFFFYVKPAKADLLLKLLNDSVAAHNRFKSAAPEILSAILCYMYEQDTASVFHSMRALEHGLRALAKRVGVRFTIQQWQNAIDQIESKITGMQKTLPKGEKRMATLQFYSEAAKEFRYFKDGWRNYAAHAHAAYDEHQSISVLQHVLAFMSHISTRLKETKKH